MYLTRLFHSSLFLSVLALALSGCSVLQVSSSLPQQNLPIQDGAGLGSIEISQALLSGDPLSCMIAKTNENKQMSLSLHGGKFFLTGNALTPTGTDATLVYDTDYVYVWENGEAEGLKSQLPSRADLKIALDAARQSGVNIPDPSDPNSFSQLEAEGYSISCQSVTITDSVFVPPATTHFTDITDTVQKTIEALKKPTSSPTPEIVL